MTNFRKITVEETFITPGLLEIWREFVENQPETDPGFVQMMGGITHSELPGAVYLRDKLLDFEGPRLDEMNQFGIEKQLLGITCPGVQMLDPDKGVEAAVACNDDTAQWVNRYPDRFAALAAIAPQAPDAAAAELERAVSLLGFKGGIINSHTRGEYLDDKKFWPIFEAAQAMDVPIYIHPREPAPQMLSAYQGYPGLDGAVWGFAAETGLHAMRLILSGVFDEFPKLKIVLGHMGESIPYWLPRLDSRLAVANMIVPEQMRTNLKRKPSEYFLDHFYVTTSGVHFDPVLRFCLEVMGADKVMFAVDYPYEITAEAVQFINEATISDADKKAVCAENAERIFKL